MRYTIYEDPLTHQFTLLPLDVLGIIEANSGPTQGHTTISRILIRRPDDCMIVT